MGLACLAVAAEVVVEQREDAGRAVAAYLARRRFGYRATAVAVALGYGSGSAVSHAIRRIDNGPAELRRTVESICEALQ